MITINPYLNFPGTTEEAFNFYKSVFGGEFTMIQRFKETPDASKFPGPLGEKIMHIALPVGGTVLMATDAIESLGQKLTLGNNSYISIQTDDRAEADRIFTGLSAGGTVEMPMTDMFWGAYFGSFSDKFGIQWMINCDTKSAK